MENNKEYIDQLIAVFLGDEANAEEIQQLEFWRKESAENERYFQQLSKIYSTTSVLPLPDVDVDAAWNKIRKQINASSSSSGNIIHMPSSAMHLNLVLKIAAVLIFLAGFSWWAFLRESAAKQISLQSTENIVNDTLPDGSIMILNRNSSIAYSSAYGNKERTIQLTGEAYFKVKHNADKPFRIETKGVFIEDIGTEFNVKTYKGDDSVVVFVAEGEVRFYNDKQQVHLTKGERAVYKVSSGKIEKIAMVDPNDMAYATQNLDFKNMTLEEVASIMNSVYGIEIDVDKEIQQCKITAAFHQEQPETILLIIAETLNIEVVHEMDHIHLKGKGCIN